MLLLGVFILFALAVSVTASRAATPLIIAHRGASFHAPENTLAAFRLAWEQGADGIELDVRLTSDDHVVCVHDPQTKRVAERSLVVKDTFYRDLEALDVGAWKGETWRGETMPLLEDVLATVADGKQALIELKTGPEIVSPLAKVLERTAVSPSSIVIMSFDAPTVAACKERLPHVKCHLLARYHQQPDGTWSPTADEVIASIRRAGADGLGSEANPACFDEDFVRRLRAAGIHEFHVWTVDDPVVGRFYQRLGVWSITTNRPAILRAELEARPGEDTAENEGTGVSRPRLDPG